MLVGVRRLSMLFVGFLVLLYAFLGRWVGRFCLSKVVGRFYRRRWLQYGRKCCGDGRWVGRLFRRFSPFLEGFGTLVGRFCVIQFSLVGRFSLVSFCGFFKNDQKSVRNRQSKNSRI